MLGSRNHHRRFTDALSTLHRSFTDASPKGAFVSDEPAEKPLTGRARSLANLKRYPKGQTGNPSGRTKDIVRFGTLLMREFYKTVPANLGGKTVNKMQGEIIAMQMIKGAINKGPMAQKLLLQFIVEHEGRLARLEERKLRKQLEGTSEINWDEEKERAYQDLMARATTIVHSTAHDDDKEQK